MRFAVLNRDYNHVDCLQETALEEIEDEVLRELVAEGVQKMIDLKSASTPVDAASDNSVDADVDAAEAMTSNLGGCISFLLTKAAGGLAADA